MPEKRKKKTNKKSSSDWIVYRSADGGPLFRSRDSCCLLPSIIMGRGAMAKKTVVEEELHSGILI